MEDRREFIKAAGLSLLGAPFISTLGDPFQELVAGGPVIKQPEVCEAVYVRENTLITFHLTQATDGNATASLLSEILIPGSVIPVHKHIHHDEFFLFMGGSGEITVNETVYRFQPGTTGFVPRNTFHGLRNTSSENVQFFFGYAPAGFEDFFRHIGTPKGQSFQPKPKAEADAIAKKYGMVFK